MVGKKPGANLARVVPADAAGAGRRDLLPQLRLARPGPTAQGRFALRPGGPRAPGASPAWWSPSSSAAASRTCPCWQEPVEVQPGGTATVTVGGQGRPVVGRVVLDGTPEPPIDWRQNNPAEIQLPRGKLGQGPRGWDRYASNLDKDGRFRIDDVPPGQLRARPSR